MPAPGINGVIDNVNTARRNNDLIERQPGAHEGEPCPKIGGGNLCGSGIYRVPFTNKNGKTKYLRWKLRN